MSHQRVSYWKYKIYSGQELEAEGNDRYNLSLPGKQLELLQDVVAIGNKLSKTLNQ